MCELCLISIQNMDGMQEELRSSFLRAGETVIPMGEDTRKVKSQRKKCLVKISTLLGTLLLIGGTALIFVAKEAFWDRAFLENMAEEIQNKISLKFSTIPAQDRDQICPQVKELSLADFETLNITSNSFFRAFDHWRTSVCD